MTDTRNIFRKQFSFAFFNGNILPDSIVYSASCFRERKWCGSSPPDLAVTKSTRLMCTSRKTYRTILLQNLVLMVKCHDANT